MQVKVPLSQDGWRLLDALGESMGISKAKAKKLLDARSVFVNRKRVWMAKHQVAFGDVLEAPAQPDTPAARECELCVSQCILQDDPDFIVFAKPAGIDSEGTQSFEALVKTQLGNGYRLVHRLDRDTSGALIVAKSQSVKELFIELFKAKKVYKEYRAVVHGMVKDAMTIRDALDDKKAVTHVTPLATDADSSLLKVVIETGRTHQIRRHLAAHGHPVVGERQYLTKRVRDDDLRNAPRHLLHALVLEFPHPKTGQRIRVEAPLPEDMKGRLAG